jgi:FdhD protein
MDSMQQPATKRVSVQRFDSDKPVSTDLDALTIEEPFEIRVAFRRRSTLVQRPISITMRTPGNDRELAVGFLFTEGIIHEKSWIEAIEEEEELGSSLLIRLNRPIDLQRLERHFYTSSSCGVCGKASLAALRMNRAVQLPPAAPAIDPQTLLGLPAKLAGRQEVFSRTGGLHAAAFFSAAGELLALYEDVGRHNAVDKLIGSVFLNDQLDFAQCLLVVSGRAGFELVQKSLMAGVPFFAAVGAPSSIAVELAQHYGSTLVGFLREKRFNVYAGPERIL